MEICGGKTGSQNQKLKHLVGDALCNTNAKR